MGGMVLAVRIIKSIFCLLILKLPTQMTYKNFIQLFCLLFLANQVKAQVIYERTYPNGYPSIKNAFELSDSSTVSFANNSTCYFAGWRHISSTGSIIKQGGLAGESTHSLRSRQIGTNSILVSFREGPLDYPGSNYFRVVLWRPDTMTTLVLDSVHYNYWDDKSGVQYDAFLIADNHVLYQRGDTIFSKNLITGQTDFRETFFHITHVYPVLDGLMIFSAGLPPTYFNNQIEEVNTWLNIPNHPISFNDMVAMDSFIIGININMPTSLHAVNAFNENSQDIDLSAYFTLIDSLVVRGDILIASGRNGNMRYALQLDRNFDIINGTPFVAPDTIYPWVFSIYPERLYAWRIDGFSGYGADYRIAYPFLDPTPITYVDLAFEDISVDSVEYWSPPNPGAPVILKLSAYIINKSVDTLHSFTIHYQEEPSQFCDPGVYPSHFKDLNTPPGDTAVVKYSLIVWASEAEVPILRTYYVQHGNHHLDSNRIDNSFNLNYLINSAEEPVLESLNVYPNPFTDFLRINDVSESAQLFLFDQTGRLVSSGYGQLNNLGYLPTGMYVLQVVNGQTISVNRVLKVE